MRLAPMYQIIYTVTDRKRIGLTYHYLALELLDFEK